jgi:phenylalanyl-tRNA synthetase beta subunit
MTNSSTPRDRPRHGSPPTSLSIAGGTYYVNDDYYPNPVVPKLKPYASRLHLLSGMDLTLATAKKILKSLEYSVIDESKLELTVEIPYFRTDVEVEDDLISDILRIHNYTNILTQAIASPVSTDLTPEIYRFEDKLRDLLVAQGAHEHITNSLVTSVNQSDQIILVNAFSTDQNALRHNLSDGLSHVLTTYKKHKIGNILVFEIGKTFTKQKNNYLEHRLLTVCSTLDVRDSLATLLSSLGIVKYQPISITPTSYTLVTNDLMSQAKNYTGIVSDFTHTQSRDISLLASFNLTYANISKVINNLTSTIQSVSCKSFTKLKNKNNYLITLVWPQNSDVNKEQALVLKSLQKELGIECKS